MVRGESVGGQRMSVTSAKRRGAATQKAVATYLAGNGWEWATDCGAGRTGNDILNVPGLCVEVKARKDFAPMAALRQAATGGSGLPLFVYRPPGAGLATVADWPATLRLADLVRVLRGAGYGDPLPPTGLLATR